jgi:hypothetical protein
MRRTTWVMALLVIAGTAAAQGDGPAPGDEEPIGNLLYILDRVSPAARSGAEAYMAAFLARCGRPLSTLELRRAFAEGNGNPTLMAMIRGMHENDAAAVRRLSDSLVCPRS